ncbi:MAG: homoserine kinase [Oligoflexus sp.]
MAIKIFAPATIGNVGPGFDVLGLAVSGLGDHFEIDAVDDPAASLISVAGRDAEFIPNDPQKNTVTLAAQYLAQSQGKTLGFQVHIERSLPVSGGLGASAASSVAGALGAGAILNVTDKNQILAAALHAEAMVAGRHLDNIAPCLLGGLCVVQNVDPPIVYRALYRGDFSFVLLTPAVQIDTKKSRSLLPTSLDNAAWIKQMALTASLVTGFSLGDAAIISKALQDPFAEPKRGPLIPNFSQAKQAALQEGALAFAISGGGPSCFALCENASIAGQVAEACLAAFGSNTSVHIGPLAEEGAHIL